MADSDVQRPDFPRLTVLSNRSVFPSTDQIARKTQDQRYSRGSKNIFHGNKRTRALSKIRQRAHGNAGRNKNNLTAGDTLVDQDFDLNSPILGSSGLGLVRCLGSVFAHRSGGNDMPHRNVALLDEKCNDSFGAILA